MSNERFIPEDQSVPRPDLPVSVDTREGRKELGRGFYNLKGYIKYNCDPLNEIEKHGERIMSSLTSCQFELVSKSAESSVLTPIDDILVDLQKWQTQLQTVIKELELFIDQDVMPLPLSSPDFVEFLEKGRLLPKDDADSTPEPFSWIHTAYRILMSELTDIYWRAFAKRKDLGSTVDNELKGWEERVKSWYEPIIWIIQGV